MKNILWKVYFLILVLGAAGAAGLLPYSSALAGAVPGGMPPKLMLLASFLQSFLLTSVLGFFGLLLSSRTGLRLSVIENLLYPGAGERLRVRRHILFPILIGALSSLAVLILDLMFIEILDLQASGDLQAPAWWKGIFAAFYGGLSEEIMMRLFFLNLTLFILNIAGRKKEKKTSAGKVVTAMIISSLIFGIGHLPAIFGAGMVSTGYILRTIILNLIPGMAFGWLYWRRSFLSAMIAHFTADIFLHVVARFILDTFVSG